MAKANFLIQKFTAKRAIPLVTGSGLGKNKLF